MKLYAGDPSLGRPFSVSEKADTCVVVRNPLCYNCLAVFRVAVSLTLKTVNYLINSRLRSTHPVSSGICAAKNCTNADCKQHARLSAYPFSSLSHVAAISSMISWQRDSGILISVPALTRSALVGRPLPITDVACSPR